MRHRLRAAPCLLIFVLLLAMGGCDAPNPNAGTPTSGRLILYVDEMYAPLIQEMADTFMVRSPNAKVEIHPLSARAAVEELINRQVRSAPIADTTATVASILGRGLLADERNASTQGELNLQEYEIGYDAIALVVAQENPLRETTLGRLQTALKSGPAYPLSLDSTVPAASVQYLLPDQNSSTFMVFRSKVLGDSNISAPVRYFASGDSVVDKAAAGEGIGVIGWYRAHRDSSRVRTLLVGHTDSSGRYMAPVRIHVSTLVTDTYPLKQPIVGYTFAPINSLAVGFLAWLAKSQDAQYFLANRGIQPRNVKLRLVMPQ